MQMSLFADQSLVDARRAVERGLEGGIVCPCCGQLCRMYRRKLNVTMALALIGLVKEWRRSGSWVNIRNIPLRGCDARVAGGELAKLAHWGLIHQAEAEGTEQKCSGMWQPTDRGVDFAEGRVSVPRHVFLYNNIVRGFSDETTDIQTALSDRFDYGELMGIEPQEDDAW